MAALDDLVRSARADIAARVVADLRARLLEQPHEWVVDQLLAEIAPRLGLDRLPVLPVQRVPRHQVTPVPLTAESLVEATSHLAAWTSDRLVAEGCLLAPPLPGGPLVEPRHRSPLGEALLAEAKDLLHALLFGTPEDGVRLDRVHRELLTLTLPGAKAEVFGFLREAAAEAGAHSAWVDPDGGAHHDRAVNVLMQIEYGEVAEELVGNGIVAALRLINKLEVNEVILYARMEDVEQSPL